ncbi:Uncharacterised protein [Mycobacterium tuberculosis]|uniref:Uncharacterized protein n=1 Tax=Mycobacterium tuberculosis TaxID=1773 RepID=A0A0U0QS62_MYCTX|nr:Uncharacterised protein [Mycobacterium tuberculosis]SGO88821.1 Uncharacterised protein [Mycobacterium tuberculosis]
MTNQRWLRAKMATPSPARTPLASRPLATACAASSSSENVSVPSSSMTAARLGARLALCDGSMPTSPHLRISAASAA